VYTSTNLYQINPKYLRIDKIFFFDFFEDFFNNICDICGKLFEKIMEKMKLALNTLGLFGIGSKPKARRKI
jgi:hypothetical protein